MTSNVSKNTSISAEQEGEEPIVLIHVQTDTLNRWDLIHNLTIQNTTGVVKAETFEGLVAAAAKYGKPDKDNILRQSLAYYVYKHTDTVSKVCITPMPEKFMEDVQTVEKVYTKQEHYHQTEVATVVMWSWTQTSKVALFRLFGPSAFLFEAVQLH